MKKQKIYRGIFRKWISLFYFLLTSLIVVLPVCIHAVVLERVVAIVDDEVILKSEFVTYHKSAAASDSELSDEAVINQMINRLLFLREAGKLGIKQSIEKPENEDIIVREYIDRRIKAFIHVSYDDIKAYYNDNLISYTDKEFYDVKDEIEEYLVSRELIKRLQKYVAELRRSAYIRIQLEE